MRKKFVVITSINEINDNIRKFANFRDWHVVIIGDKKSPPISKTPESNITFLNIDNQKELGFNFFDVCPFNHYARKNLGYIYALKQGAEYILDTDDDNCPYDTWGEDISFSDTSELRSISGPKFVNIYKHFTDEQIWPRGFPLNLISNKTSPEINGKKQHKIAVWQGLADKDPDVDAIYRLVVNKMVTFDKKEPIALENGVYCPFNTQNTVWTLASCFPYIYVPISVSFRFCDILRGYIAQRGFESMNAKLAFTSASVYQERNDHNLMHDFIDEITCYTDVTRTVELLDSLKLEGIPKRDIVTIYENLQKIGVVKEADIEGVKAFISDLP